MKKLNLINETTEQESAMALSLKDCFDINYTIKPNDDSCRFKSFTEETFQVLCKSVYRYTDTNQHGMARWKIADSFGFTKTALVLKAINDIQDIRGMSRELDGLRERETHNMLQLIESVYGEEIANKIAKQL